MKFLHYVHLGLIAVFAVINGLMLYLFLLNLPYGINTFLITLAHWDKLQPQIGIVASIALAVSVGGGVLAWRMSETWKNRLLYFRRAFPHPAFDAFLTTRKQPFESKDLLAAYPEVKDGGFNAGIQIAAWTRCFSKHASAPVVINTRVHWEMLRDLYVLSLFFLIFFLLGYAANFSMPFGIAAIYVFMYGVQFIFLLLAARRVGFKMVDNVLAIGMGMDDKDQGLGGKKGGKRDRRVL